MGRAIRTTFLAGSLPADRGRHEFSGRIPQRRGRPRLPFRHGHRSAARCMDRPRRQSDDPRRVGPALAARPRPGRTHDRELPQQTALPHPAPLRHDSARRHQHPRCHPLDQNTRPALRPLHHRRPAQPAVDDPHRRRRPTTHLHQPNPQTPPPRTTLPPHPPRTGLGHTATGRRRRRPSSHARRPRGLPAHHHRRLDRPPLGRTHRPAPQPTRPRPRHPHHPPVPRSTARVRTPTLARPTQDTRRRPPHHPATIPDPPTTRTPQPTPVRVRVHHPVGHLAMALHLHPARLPTRQRRHPPRTPSHPQRPDLPRAAPQPQNLAHRRPDPRNRPSPPTRAPPRQLHRRDLQPCRPRSRTPTPHRPRRPLAHCHSSRPATGAHP